MTPHSFVSNQKVKGMRQIQFIGITVDELKEELLQDLLEGIAKIRSEEENSKRKDEYLTRKEVSQLFAVSLVTLNNWDRKGVLKPYRLGNQVRYKMSEIEESLKAIKR